ncbi:MAG: hypothetical protein FD165_2339 [Gammaproteobacteria bacterium]|nr:MAG: hypothetical protein FD165_2339 [Gammaproteobacteria bacterium]
MRPVGDTFHKTVFDRIVMQVIHMGGIIPIVADLVFPVTSLPNTSLSLFAAHVGPPLGSGQLFRE